jgi:phage terminase large subunit
MILEQLEEYQQLRSIWRTSALLYAKQRLGLNPTTQQSELLTAIQGDGAKVSVRAGHGVGKSAAVGAAIWWMLECFDFPKIPCTAPTASQLRDVLWSELGKWARRSDEISRAHGLPEEIWLSNLFTINQDRIADKGSPDQWFAVARTARKENPDALQGFHASGIRISADGTTIEEITEDGQIMFVVEEASGVDDAIFEVAEGALSSHGARLLMVGNPTRNTGYFARSHRQDRADFKPLHFACADSPLVDAGYRDRLVRKFGEGSNVVRVRADGEFPKQDDDTLIALEDVEGAITREASPASGDRRMGVDVARFGDDRTVFTLRVGNVVEQCVVRAKQDTMVTVGEAKLYAETWQADTIYVDECGLGAGVVDRLRELKMPVIGVNVAESAPENVRSRIDENGRRIISDAPPFKLRDHLWQEGARWIREDAPSFAKLDRDVAEDLAGEMASVKYRLNSSGQLVVESKDDMKRRGLRSSDIADSLLLTFAPGSGTPMITVDVVNRMRSMGRRR